MKKTKHRVQPNPGEGFQATVEHHHDKAVQYEFFIPAKIWSVPAVKRFLAGLAALEGGTISEGETGIWRGEKEKTNIFRLIVRPGTRTAADMEQMLQEELGSLMAELSGSKEHAQEAMMYTRTDITVVTVKAVKRVGD